MLSFYHPDVCCHWIPVYTKMTFSAMWVEVVVRVVRCASEALFSLFALLLPTFHIIFIYGRVSMTGHSLLANAFSPFQNILIVQNCSKKIFWGFTISMMLGIDWNDMESSHYLSILSVNHVSLSCLLTYEARSCIGKQDLASFNSSHAIVNSTEPYTIIQTN